MGCYCCMTIVSQDSSTFVSTKDSDDAEKCQRIPAIHLSRLALTAKLAVWTSEIAPSGLHALLGMSGKSLQGLASPSQGTVSKTAIASTFCSFSCAHKSPNIGFDCCNGQLALQNVRSPKTSRVIVVQSRHGPAGSQHCVLASLAVNLQM